MSDAGKIWPSEMIVREDQGSGVKVTQLTNHKCHSHHLYFTNSGWWDNNQKLLFGSDRGNKTNLFSIDLKSGEITQLTDLGPSTDLEFNFLTTCINPTRDEAYFYFNGEIFSIDLNTYEMKALYQIPKGYLKSMLNVTSDGKFLCMGLFEDFSHKFPVDLNRGYIGFREIFHEHPNSKIMAIPTKGGDAEVMWEEDCWIGHVNTSPTNPDLLSFCHEGPWGLVDNRIWGFNLKTREAWKIRPRERKENPGHEYWFADGDRIGYHGGDGRRNFIGSIKPDNTDKIEVEFTSVTGHIHSNDEKMITGDGGQHVRLWRWNPEDMVYEGPHALAEHRCSMHVQKLHVHPRFCPDGKQVLYTSDITGYGNVYLAEMPEPEDFEDLPFIFFNI
ncbi:MAG: oligogalacturonate lyase family protein [Candidatus Hodarchaeota archaeon]